jgi:hypothetical protein
MKISYKEFLTSRCAATLLLHITIITGNQQALPSPQLLRQQYYFLQEDDKEGEHKKEEEAGIH